MVRIVTWTVVACTQSDQAPLYCQIVTQISHMSKHHKTQESSWFRLWPGSFNDASVAIVLSVSASKIYHCVCLCCICVWQATWPLHLHCKSLSCEHLRVEGTQGWLKQAAKQIIAQTATHDSMAEASIWRYTVLYAVPYAHSTFGVVDASTWWSHLCLRHMGLVSFL